MTTVKPQHRRSRYPWSLDYSPGDYVAGVKSAHGGDFPLRSAAAQNDGARVRALLIEGHDPNRRDPWGWTATREAAEWDRIDALTAMLDDPRTDVAQALIDAVGTANGARTRAVALILERLPQGHWIAMKAAAATSRDIADFYAGKEQGRRHQVAADLIEARIRQDERAELSAVAAEQPHHRINSRRM